MTISTLFDFVALALAGLALWECSHVRRGIRETVAKLEATKRMLDYFESQRRGGELDQLRQLQAVVNRDGDPVPLAVVDTLDEARASVPQWTVKLERSPEDETQIVETWI